MQQKSILGLQRKTVVLSAHHPQWAACFREEKQNLIQHLPPNTFLQLEHIGSTAIIGLCAKPILDMMALVSTIDLDILSPIIKQLAHLDYTYRPNKTNNNRLLLVKGPASNRTHHLSLVADTRLLTDALFFKDYLNTNPNQAKAYEQLKQNLQVQYATDRDQYTKGKAHFIRSILVLQNHSSQ